MLSLFEDVIITDGYNRSLLVDITRGKYFLIPKKWSKIISYYNKKVSIDMADRYLQNRISSEFYQLYHFLLDKELIFDIDEILLQNFPKNKEEFETPSLLDDMFILLSKINIKTILFLFESTVFNSEWIYTYRIFIEDDLFSEQLILVEKIVNKISSNSLVLLIVNKAFKSNLRKYFNKKNIIIDYLDLCINSTFFKQNIYKEKYPLISIELSQIMGSKSHNMYYYKSIFIDSDGFIGNSFDNNSKTKIYLGDIVHGKKDFRSLVLNSQFKKIGNISSMRVEVCKDCEFRRVCIDCRIPYLNGQCWNKEDCVYNPYISKWETDIGYVSSSSCGKYLANGKFEKNESYIEEKNRMLWGDNLFSCETNLIDI